MPEQKQQETTQYGEARVTDVSWRGHIPRHTAHVTVHVTDVSWAGPRSTSHSPRHGPCHRRVMGGATFHVTQLASQSMSRTCHSGATFHVTQSTSPTCHGRGHIPRHTVHVTIHVTNVSWRATFHVTQSTSQMCHGRGHIPRHTVHVTVHVTDVSRAGPHSTYRSSRHNPCHGRVMAGPHSTSHVPRHRRVMGGATFHVTQYTSRSMSQTCHGRGHIPRHTVHITIHVTDVS